MTSWNARFRRALGTASGVVLFALGLLTQPVAARATTLYVDGDGRAGPAQGCNGHQHVPRKIQAAVNAATRDTTILVCPGVYREKVVISGATRDGVRLRGVKPWHAILRPPAGKGGDLLTIDGADRVEIQWLRLRIPTAGNCKRITSAIHVEHRSHDAEVRANRISPIGKDTIGPCGYRDGIHVENGSNAFIAYNLIRDFVDAGVAVTGCGCVSAARSFPGGTPVIGNSIRYFHASEPGAEPQYATGIYFDEAGGPATGNAIIGLPSAGQPGPAGTPLLDTGVVGTTWGGLISQNYMRDIGTGIWVDDSSLAITRNTLLRTRVEGIHVDISTGLIARNVVRDSSGNGIALDDTWDTEVRYNTALGSSGFDCFDQYQGGNWEHNVGETSDPPGLCEPPAR